MNKNILNSLALFRSQNPTATVSVEVDADEMVYVAISNGENLLADIMLPKSEIGSYGEALELALTLAGYNILGNEESHDNAKDKDAQESATEKVEVEPQSEPDADGKETDEAVEETPRKRGRRKAKQVDESPAPVANEQSVPDENASVEEAADDAGKTDPATPTIGAKDAKETVVSLNEGAEANPQIKNGILGKKLGSLNKFQLRLIGRDGKDGKAKIFTDETIAAAKALLTQ